jgi:hypothetical protein
VRAPLAAPSLVPPHPIARARPLIRVQPSRKPNKRPSRRKPKVAACAISPDNGDSARFRLQCPQFLSLCSAHEDALPLQIDDFMGPESKILWNSGCFKWVGDCGIVLSNRRSE